MSSPQGAQREGAPRGGGAVKRRDRREIARAVLLVVLAVLITLFAVLNRKEVSVDWVFDSSKAPLIVVIVVSLVVGILIGHFAQLRSRRHR